ncbi:hypothetical protein [Streptomyces sp. NPDC058045]|uniref:hypothetical protein n=1 Tax=Streptomyces sp. NPDC058045 TaxID=3346311 RepID=UPI0036F18E17
MRHLPIRHLATSALCAALVLGTALPVAAQDDSPAGGAAGRSVPVPEADALLTQTAALRDTSAALAPVSRLLDAVLRTDEGKLSPDQARRYSQSVREGIAAARESVRGGGNQNAQLPSSARTLPARPQTPAAELRASALDRLQTRADTLLAAAEKGDREAVSRQAPKLVTAAVNHLAATLLAGGLPAPDLPGLPDLPRMPSASGPVTGAS